MFSITSVLALFTLLVLSSAVFFASKRVKIPYTVLLVIVGLILVPLAKLPLLEPIFGFIDDLTLTPELLFYIFLPILIFESAFNMNVRKMVDSAWSITLLSIVSLIISALLIATALFFILPLIGLPIPFIVALLFASIISATDPVAVLALFKEFGAPKRLTLIFEGESLFNDGTAVALFLVVLAIAQNGFHGAGTVIEGIGMFLMMVFGGILFGIVMAILFSRALRYTRSNEFVSITLLIVSAHVVFILCELINIHGIFGFHIHLSSIIATTVAALFLGNYSRHILSPQSDEYIEKSVGHLAFVINSLVFILIGILFASTQISLSELWLPILITILVVATARAISVYSVIIPLNKLKLEAHIPTSWQHLLSYGSLRGALAIIVVLLIPTDYKPTDWMYSYSPQQFLLALTIGCILATLFIKAVTIGALVNKLRVNAPSPLDEAHELDLALYYLFTKDARFEEQKAKGFVDASHHKAIKEKVQLKIEEVRNAREALRVTYGDSLFEQSLHLAAVDIEEHYLKELYINREVSERVYRKIKGKLTLQREKIEAARHEEIDPSVHTDRKDVFDSLMTFMQTALDKKSKTLSAYENFQYYRAQTIISRKVVKTLTSMQEQYGAPVFINGAFEKVVELYATHKKQAQSKMDTLVQTSPDIFSQCVGDLSERSLESAGNKSLKYLQEKGIATESVAHGIEEKYSL